MRDLFQRLGTLEWRADDAAKSHEDHENRLRKLEHLTAKVVGGAIVGSAVGSWLLSTMTGCF
jgi:hypothetical protein